MGELDPEQRQHVGWQTRLVEEGGRVVRMDIVNGRGRFWADSPTVASTRFVYDGQRVVERIGLDRNGIVRRRKLLTANSERWVDALGRPLPEEKSKASGAERELDAKGRVIALRYVDATGAPATRADGVSTVRFVYGVNGSEDERYFTREGAPQTNEKGIHRIARELNAKGLDLLRRFLDEYEKPAPRKDGVQSIRESYDEYGNLIEERTFDAEGRLHLAEDKTALVRIESDEWGAEITKRFFDDHEAPTISSYGYITRHIMWNDDGQAIQWSFYDGKGRPAQVRGREHSVRRRVLDARGRSVHESSFDTGAMPFTIDGTQQNDLLYDERDNLIRRNYFTETGAVTKSENEHFSSFRQTFDLDRLVRKEYLDENGNLYPLNGSAGIAYTFDALGVSTKHRLDSSGAIVEDPPAAN